MGELQKKADEKMAEKIKAKFFVAVNQYGDYTVSGNSRMLESKMETEQDVKSDMQDYLFDCNVDSDVYMATIELEIAIPKPVVVSGKLDMTKNVLELRGNDGSC